MEISYLLLYLKGSCGFVCASSNKQALCDIFSGSLLASSLQDIIGSVSVSCLLSKVIFGYFVPCSMARITCGNLLSIKLKFENFFCKIVGPSSSFVF